MSEISRLTDSLSQELQGSLPGIGLRWYPVGEALQGLFLEEEPALRPLPAERVEAVMDAPPFWSLLWPSGEFLCRLIGKERALVGQRSVLDFGSGCGLVASAASLAGAGPVYAVDSDPLAAQATRLHALVGGATVEVVEHWDFRPVDLFLAADFLYDTTHLELFARLADQAEEVMVVDSRLRELKLPGFAPLGSAPGRAVPDLERRSPTREFGVLNLWYRGPREQLWRVATQALLTEG